MVTMNYNGYPDSGVAGLVAYMGNSEQQTYYAAESIGYGKAVALKGSTENSVEVLSASNTAIVGIAAYKSTNVSGTPYEQYDPVIVLRKGAIWVKVDTDVNAGDHAYIANATGNATNSSTDATDTHGEFKTSAVAGEIAILDINLPNR